MNVVLLRLSNGSSIPDCSSQVSSSCPPVYGTYVFRVEAISRYAMEIYKTTVTTLTRAIVITAS